MPQLVETSEGLARVEGELSMRGNKSVATAIVYPAQAPIVALDVLRCIPNGSVALDPTINCALPTLLFRNFLSGLG